MLSVVASVYRSEGYLYGFFQNLLEQTYKDFEVVLVLNEPTEKELSIVEQYKTQLTIIYTIVPLELVATSMNRAIGMTTGDIIITMGADDLFVEVAFSKFIQAFLDNPDIDIVYCDFIAFKSNGKIYWIGESIDYNFSTLKNGYYLPPCNIFKRTILDKEVGYKEEYNLACVYEFMLRLGSKGYKFHHIPEILIKFIRRSSSYTIIHKNAHASMVKRIKNEYQNITPM